MGFTLYVIQHYFASKFFLMCQEVFPNETVPNKIGSSRNSVSLAESIIRNNRSSTVRNYGTVAGRRCEACCMRSISASVRTEYSLTRRNMSLGSAHKATAGNRPCGQAQSLSLNFPSFSNIQHGSDLIGGSPLC